MNAYYKNLSSLIFGETSSQSVYIIIFVVIWNRSEATFTGGNHY